MSEFLENKGKISHASETSHASEIGAEFTDDELKQMVAIAVDKSRFMLKTKFGVKNFTTIEGVHLRHIVEEMIRRTHNELQLAYAGEMRSEHIIDPSVEAVFAWISRLYGIRYADIPIEASIKDKRTGEVTKYTTYGQFLADRNHKMNKIVNNGDAPEVEMTVTDDFKEYLKRIRRKAHIPEPDI
jgi:hypothetical protein